MRKRTPTLNFITDFILFALTAHCSLRPLYYSSDCYLCLWLCLSFELTNVCHGFSLNQLCSSLNQFFKLDHVALVWCITETLCAVYITKNITKFERRIPKCKCLWDTNKNLWTTDTNKDAMVSQWQSCQRWKNKVKNESWT